LPVPVAANDHRQPHRELPGYLIPLSLASNELNPSGLHFMMGVVYNHCCDFDVHKRTVTACRFIPCPVGHPGAEVRTFATLTRELLAA
jgi:hypothetical protein